MKKAKENKIYLFHEVYLNGRYIMNHKDKLYVEIAMYS